MIELHPREQAGKYVASLISKHLENQDDSESMMVVFTNTQEALAITIAQNTRKIIISCHRTSITHLVTGDTDSQAGRIRRVQCRGYQYSIHGLR